MHRETIMPVKAVRPACSYVVVVIFGLLGQVTVAGNGVYDL